MKRIYKILLALVIPVILVGIGAYWYTFMQPHKNLLKVEPEFEIGAENFFTEFSDDETTSNAKYLGKVVEITGKVVELNKENNQTVIVLKDELFGVSTYLDENFCKEYPEILETVKVGDTVTLRGQCDGMLSDVVVSRAVIIQ
ncbi:MAG: hypothetical protein ABFR62_04195 [Bacteroidota bacterium]